VVAQAEPLAGCDAESLDIQFHAHRFYGSAGPGRAEIVGGAKPPGGSDTMQ
jgi:hypothetical protein